MHAKKEKLAKFLCESGFKDDLDKIRLLKECEGDLNAADYDGRTVAHLAAAERHWELLKYLVRESSLMVVKDRWGKTPLDEIKEDEKKQEFEHLMKEST